MDTAIKTFIDARGVKSLFHFTRLNNLPSILENGLLTKEACARAGINPAVNDTIRYDGTDAISVTISYPNYKMFYRLRCDNPDVEWVVLKLTCSLLWQTMCAFSDTNAGDGLVYSVPIARRQGVAALQSMFSDYGNIKRTTLGIPDNYTTNPQAEVLLLDGATVDDITGVYFQTLVTYQKYKAQYLDLKCSYRGRFFDGRSDYLHWR
jgi:hypothetical protein